MTLKFPTGNNILLMCKSLVPIIISPFITFAFTDEVCLKLGLYDTSLKSKMGDTDTDSEEVLETELKTDTEYTSLK